MQVLLWAKRKHGILALWDCPQMPNPLLRIRATPGPKNGEYKKMSKMSVKSWKNEEYFTSFIH
jgi:hypothetical protein